jgi:hypothetical protein
VRPPRALNPRLDARDHTFSRLAKHPTPGYAFRGVIYQDGQHASMRMTT